MPKDPLKKEYLEIQIPRFSFKDAKINVYLVTALVVFAFFLGMLTDKVLYLEKQLKNNNTPTNNVNNVLGNANNAPSTIPTPAKINVRIGHLPNMGGKNAKVTVIEFSDLQCPFCQQFINNTYPELYDAYIKTNKIKFAFRHYPLSSIHPNAQKAAEAAECANEQNKFWEYHNLLFKNQQTWSPQTSADADISFTSYAGELGLDTNQFQSCLTTEKYKNKVQEDAADGNKAGVDATPTFFINGVRLVGAIPFGELQKIIEGELKK